MTTDELRAWMKALEEQDVRIVALEKRLTELETKCQPLRANTYKPKDIQLTIGERELKPVSNQPWQYQVAPIVQPTFESSVAQARDERLEKANAAARVRGWRDIWHFAAMRGAERHSGSEIGVQVAEALAYMQEHGLPLDANLAADIRRRGWLR